MQGPGVGTEDGIVAVNFYSVWGTSGTNVFAVGESNTGFSRAIIARYDGVRWSDMDLPVRDDRILRDVFGTSPQDVYAVGYFDVSVSLRRGASSVAPSRLLVEGVVLHYDGTRWSEIQSAGGSVALNGVWASASTDVFAVGSSNDHAIIYHFDGTSWATMTVPPTGPLLDVWGTSSTDVYAVGAGTILHYDGQSWIEVRADVERLAGVWASSASDVFAVGSGGTILRGTPGTAGSANP
jgi:hypothetical protein